MKAAIRAKENGRHPRHAEKERDRRGREKKGEEGRRRGGEGRADSDDSSSGHKPFFFRSRPVPPSVVSSYIHRSKELVKINKSHDDDFPREL